MYAMYWYSLCMFYIIADFCYTYIYIYMQALVQESSLDVKLMSILFAGPHSNLRVM